ncbi:MAG: creatininase family protein [Eubacteriales bacterium]|jgi:creatinine amidohydrolase
MAYNLTDYPFPVFQEMVKTTPTVILPVGLIEQHGHHLPLGTDIFNVTEPLRIGAEKIHAFVAPGLYYCFSGGGIQGTMNVNPQLFGLMVTNICTEFAGMGFRSIVILLGHGGTENIDALKMSLQVFLRDERYKDIAVCVCCCESPTYQRLWRNSDAERDFHAGQGETSMMLYWRPDLVRMDALAMDEPDVARNLRADQDWYAKRERVFDDPTCIERVTQRDEVKVGVMGFPERATAAEGEIICREIIDALADLCNRLNARK